MKIPLRANDVKSRLAALRHVGDSFVLSMADLARLASFRTSASRLGILVAPRPVEGGYRLYRTK